VTLLSVAPNFGKLEGGAECPINGPTSKIDSAFEGKGFRNHIMWLARPREKQEESQRTPVRSTSLGEVAEAGSVPIATRRTCRHVIGAGSVGPVRRYGVRARTKRDLKLESVVLPEGEETLGASHGALPVPSGGVRFETGGGRGRGDYQGRRPGRARAPVASKELSHRHGRGVNRHLRWRRGGGAGGGWGGVGGGEIGARRHPGRRRTRRRNRHAIECMSARLRPGGERAPTAILQSLRTRARDGGGGLGASGGSHHRDGGSNHHREGGQNGAQRHPERRRTRRGNKHARECVLPRLRPGWERQLAAVLRCPGTRAGDGGGRCDADPLHGPQKTRRGVPATRSQRDKVTMTARTGNSTRRRASDKPSSS
jgi:hypothetical protein